ncbi:hypothetical protein [Allobranchiibius sp. CTAmp26]|uniref:hypothetical protein n=1 Tax=Allobranchiibius sp. CTAmp26 TaxID=2815214 RepID=UPI001AA1129A|nr:hypothetical protein [Allobranchiibius sp. CTAmp26]MBO1756682.1 hypothetical protein [Allobranchiibius sp. CTAmp26]
MAWLEPEILTDGQPLTIHIANCADLSGRTLQVDLGYVDAVDSAWCLSTPIVIDGNGRGTTTVPSGLSLGTEAIVMVTQIKSPEENILRQISSSRPATLNSAISSPKASEEVLAELLAKQGEMYGTPLGKVGAGTIEHRVVILVEGLLLTQPAKLPGWSIQPLSPSLGMEEYRLIVNQVVRDLGWAPGDIASVEPWRSQASSAYPLCAAVFPAVWAVTYEDAGRMTEESVRLALALLSANRGAAGRPVVVAIQQRQSNDGVLTKLSLPGAQYLGNLAGGFIAGEDQRFLLDQVRASEKDPIIRLAYELLAEAIPEASVDARYFRYWSILELLSGARIAPGQVVTLLNGSPWPGDPNATTSAAAPRVYEYLRSSTTASQDGAAGPGRSLYEQVRIWYARRNATGHYGRLVPGDSRQVSKGWYNWAMRSVDDRGEPLGQLSVLKETVIRALAREVRANSGSA